MDLIIIIAIGAIVAATGIISPEPKDNDISEEVKVVKTEEVTPPPPEPEPTPEPEPEQPSQEETSSSESTDDQSSNDDENNNR